MNFDLRTNIELAMQCLEATLPFCREAGITTQEPDAYDEWDTLVEAVFKSFIIMPVVEELGEYSASQFQRIGFELSPGLVAIRFRLADSDFYLFDFADRENSEIELVGVGLDRDSEARRYFRRGEIDAFYLSKVE